MKTSWKIYMCLAVLAAPLLVAGPDSSAQLYHNSVINAKITPLQMQASLSAALKDANINKHKLSYPEALKAFYAQRDNRSYWMGTHVSHSDARKLLKTFEGAWTHGLNPEHYHVGEIRDLIDREDVSAQARLDLLLTDALARYGRDLSGMRVDPGGMTMDAKGFRRLLTAEDILSALNKGEDLEKVLKALEPQGKTYQLLREELMELNAQPDESYEAILPIRLGGILRPGWSHKKVMDLRVRLGVKTDIRQPYFYDDGLAAAVMKFQRENGLVADGVIGSSTLEMLNQTRNSKMLRIIANLERLRWAPRQRPDRFVIVNIPSATLWAIDKGRVAFEMPVIVGNPVRKTQSFITQIKGVRFNPDWTVPPTIKRYDILPKLREDPNYLQDKGMELIRGYGQNAETLDPSSIDWANITSAELSALRMIQIPGDHNPLGRVRILMPNKYNIYLHDTNHRELFDSAARAVSSGCIRMQDPEKMAAFVMRGQPGWKASKMKEVLKTGKTTDVAIESPISVYIMYYTVWTDNQGKIVYGNDVYAQDYKLLDRLAAIDGWNIPSHNGGSSQDVQQFSALSLIR